MRCKIIGEGGNLGCTQLGRIEFARAGGSLNTDAIDNSAGVDCSDHEVNLKIAFSPALVSGKISVDERNKLLSKMTDDVANLVLLDNYKQTQIISIEVLGKIDRTNAHEWLIKKLEANGELDRKIEFLPKSAEIKALAAQGKRLSRPEIAVVLAYAKNSAFQALCKHDLTKEKSFDHYLIKYFPKEFSKKCPNLFN